MFFTESETQFFDKTNTNAQVTFVRDSSGKVTELMIRQINRETAALAGAIVLLNAKLRPTRRGRRVYVIDSPICTDFADQVSVAFHTPKAFPAPIQTAWIDQILVTAQRLSSFATG